MDVPVRPADASVAEVEAALREAGCVVVERLVDASALDAIEAELAPFLAATAVGGDEFTGFKTRRTGSLLARSVHFRELAAHPLVLGTLDGVLGDHATSYQLHLTQVIEIGPGEPAQLVHRDQWAFDFFPFPSGFEVECHTMWAMSDFTEANGATRGHPRQSSVGGQATTDGRPDGAGRDAEGFGAALSRLRVPRWRREPFGRAAPGRERRATRCRGCGRRRTSTWRARPRSRVSCPRSSRGSRGIAGARTRSAISAICRIRSRP